MLKFKSIKVPSGRIRPVWGLKLCTVVG